MTNRKVENPVRPNNFVSQGSEGDCVVCGLEKEDVEIEIDKETEEEVARSKVNFHKGKMPTQQEIDEHEVDHLPFRKWCQVCLSARGVDDPHKAREISEDCEEVHLDYCFFLVPLQLI